MCSDFVDGAAGALGFIRWLSVQRLPSSAPVKTELTIKLDVPNAAELRWQPEDQSRISWNAESRLKRQKHCGGICPECRDKRSF
jgi:hypothetical protein